MPSKPKNGALCAPGESGTMSPCSSTRQTEANSATDLLIKLFRDSAPTSRRKSDRIMLDKGVNPMRSRQTGRKGRGPELPSYESHDVLQGGPATSMLSRASSKTTRDVPLTIAFSQSSHYTSTEELETHMLQVNEEAEESYDPFIYFPEETRSDPKSSEASLSQTGTDLAQGQPAGLGVFIPEKNADRNATREDGSSLRSRMTVTSAHGKEGKQDRPIRRSTRGLGHSVPTTSTVNIAISPVEAEETRESSNPYDIVMPWVGGVGDGMPLESSGTPISSNTGKVGQATEAPSDVLKESDEDRKSPIIVAHNKEKQRLLDRKGIAKGVQFEIARGITHGWWIWDDITDEVVDNLRGTNFEKAGKVAQIIGEGPKERASAGVDSTTQAIFAELDREQEAFVENEGRGLGLKGPWKGKENWYGGRVQLTANLEFNKNAGNGQSPFSIRLNSFRTGKSNRAARLFTSLSILQLKFEKEALFDKKSYQLATELLSRHLVICGRLYCAFCTKEGKIFFVETKEDYERKARGSDGDQYRLSYRKLVKTINPLDLNKSQSMNKWLARWQLLLSTSRPVLEFQPEHIYLDLDDVYGVESDKDSIMTDGCGWINYTALQQIAAATNSNFPVVVQGRIGGSKGLWLLHPAEEHRSPTEPPKIWIRRSQNKIQLPSKETWHRSLRIFDLVRLPRLSVPSSLNEQTILNMSNNGVEDDVFARLMEAGLKAEIEPLSKWDGENACVLLAKAVEEAGRILTARRTRGAGGEARLYSYVPDEVDEADNNDDPEINGFLVERDSISGLPVFLYENARDMLLSGFTPSQNAVLRHKLKYVLKQLIKYRLERFHIKVASSAEAFIAPDPYGVLEEGEIYFNCTTAVGDVMTCIDPHTFSGPVLVSRNPTMVPSDVRKVTAVSRDQLLKYKDVIIFSTKGKRSLASYLGGGDYDGDTATIIAEPSIVNAFCNSELVHEPRSVREAFEEEVEKVSEFINEIKSVSRQEFSREVSKRVLRGLSDGKVGYYSKFHDIAAYELGYHEPETIRLAYMFTTCLDAVKSGLRIKDAVFKEDSRKWNVPRPPSMQKDGERSRIRNTEGTFRRLTRPPNSKPFVLDTLKSRSEDLADRALADFEELCEERAFHGFKERPDDDLTRPYLEMKKFATHLRDKYDKRVSGPLEDLEKIESFVRSLCEEYISATITIYGGEDNREESSSKAIPVAKLNHEFADRFRAGLSDCVLDLPPDTLQEVKASYAHYYGVTKSKTGFRFGFAVAHDTLCALKIRAKGGSSISRECRDFVLVSSNLVKLIRDD